MAFFSEKIDNKDASSKLPNFPPKFAGVVVTDRVKGITTTKREDAFVVEFTVESSNMPETVAPGTRYSWFQKIMPMQEDTAYGAILQYYYAALALDPAKDKKTIDEKIKPNQSKLLNLAVSDANPLAGRRVFLQTTTKITKEKRQEFTLHNFTIAPPAATVAA